MGATRLVSSPGDSYRETMIECLRGAERFWLVAAFASPAGIEVLAPAIRHALASATGQGQIVVSVDRRAFNVEQCFRLLLDLKREAGPRLSLGLVPQESGLMHAKALLTRGQTGSDLLVGSANLTGSALAKNHELGVWLHDPPPELEGSFRDFLKTLAPVTLDTDNAARFLEQYGVLTTTTKPAHPPAASKGDGSGPAWKELLEVLRTHNVLAPLTDTPDAHVARWIDSGYLVGRGRRATDALALRLPFDALERRGLVQPVHRRSIGHAARESRALGYAIELLPTAEAEAVRKEARRATSLVSKLALNLPCFGLWMPASYWDTFVAVRERVTSRDALSPDRILELATRQREYLLGGGLDDSLRQVVARLREEDAVRAEDEAAVLADLTPRLRAALASRTPSVVANAIEFRTARQRWAPFEQTDVPFRQLMVDIVQATFGATFRTGRWPQRFRSHPARTVASAVEKTLLNASLDVDGDAATRLLDLASDWEEQDRSFTEVVDEFRQFVPLDIRFEPPSIDELLSESQQDSAETEEDVNDDV